MQVAEGNSPNVAITCLLSFLLNKDYILSWLAFLCFIGCLSCAAGFFSVLIISSLHLQSFWLGWIVRSWPLFWALFISFVLGTAYSINVSIALLTFGFLTFLN